MSNPSYLDLVSGSDIRIGENEEEARLGNRAHEQETKTYFRVQSSVEESFE